MTLSLGPVIGTLGGGVEEIPVSMSGSGNGTTYPLTTVDAGDGAMIVVAGTMEPGTSAASSRPHIRIGDFTHTEPHPLLTGAASGVLPGGYFVGLVDVAVITRTALSTTTFTGTVYVARF